MYSYVIISPFVRGDGSGDLQVRTEPRTPECRFAPRSALSHMPGFLLLDDIVRAACLRECTISHHWFVYETFFFRIDSSTSRCVPVLVACISRDVDAIKVLALDTLYYCTERVETALLQCLAGGLVPILVGLLATENPEVVEKAGSLLSALTSVSRGVDGGVRG